jgi:hypothetical protein
MKIHEIITEKKQLDEAGVLGTALNVAGKVARKFVPKAKNAEVAAAAVEPGRIVKAWNATSPVLGAGIRYTAGLANAYTAMNMIKPFTQYWENMKNAQARLDAGLWTQEEYNAARQDQMTRLIGNVSTMLVGNALIKSVPGITKALIPLRIGKTDLISGAIDAIATIVVPGARAYFTKWAASPEGRTAIAGLISVLPDSQYVGSWGVHYLDQIKKVAGIANTTGSLQGAPKVADPTSQASAAPANTGTGETGDFSSQLYNILSKK